VYVSRRFEALVGGPARAWLGRTDGDVFPEETARQFQENDRAVIDGGRVVETTEIVPCGDGSRLVWWVFKFPFTDAAGRRYVGGVGVDVTERERVKAELRQRNAELQAALDKVRQLEELVTMCAWTRRVRLGDRWVSVEEFLTERLGARVTHGISEDALAGALRELGHSSGPPADGQEGTEDSG
jgi:PAS domain S-box-containing protein